MRSNDTPDQPARNRHRCLVGHYVNERLVDPHFLTRLHMPGYNLSLDDPFAQVR
jgi:hypothetical protein